MTNTKKTDRKNKTKMTVNLPSKSECFTIDQLYKNYNPDFIPITLRTRVTKMVETKQIVQIAETAGGAGRPSKVFAVGPDVSDEAIKAATVLNCRMMAEGVVVPVIDIDSEDDNDTNDVVKDMVTSTATTKVSV